MSGFLRHSLAAAAMVVPLLAQDPGPGVHRFKLGKAEVTTLQDGAFQLPATLLKGIDAAQAKALLGGKDTHAVPVNAFLVRMPGHLVLVDTGAGTAAGDAAGHLAERLKAAGVDPGQIDLVLITHCHMDHVGGLLKADGTRAFPNATLRMAQAESDFWTGDAARVPERNRAALPALKAIVAAYAGAGKFKAFAPGEALGEGIQALPTAGHTPGHACYAFTSGGNQVWCVGDLIHFGPVQFPHPDVAVGFDWDTAKAVAARKELFLKAAQAHATIAGAHLAFPGLFLLEAKDGGFTATPVL